MVTDGLSEKVNSNVSLETIEWSFPNSFVLNDVYIEDQHQDTLLYIDRTKVTINLLNLLRAQVSFRTLQLTGMNAHISKIDSSQYNFQFFIDAFLSKEKDSTAIKWSMDIESIAFDDCAISYHNEAQNSRKGRFNPNYIEVSSLNGSLNVRHFSRDSIHVRLHEISFKELSGLELSNFSTTLTGNKEKLKLNNFVAQMPNSKFALNDATFLYGDYQSIRRFASEVFLSIDIAPSQLNLTDLAAFIPAFHSLRENMLLEGSVSGTLSQLLIRNLLLKYGDHVNVQGDFFFDGLPDLESLYLRANIKEIAASTKEIGDIAQAFSKKKVELPSVLDSMGVIGYSGEIRGSLTELKANGTLSSAAGSLATNVSLKAGDLSYKCYSVNGKVTTASFNLAKLFGAKSELGNSTFKLDVGLERRGKNQVSLNAAGIIDSIVYRKYAYENILINGIFNNNSFDGSLIMSDKNADLSFKGNVDFNKEKPIFRFVANVNNAKLANLNLITKYPGSSLSFDIETNFTGKSLDDIEGSFSIDNVMFAYGDKEILINNLSLTAILQENEKKKLSLYSDYINGYLTGQYLFTSILNNLRNLAYEYVPAVVKNKKEESTKYQKKNDFEFRFTIDNTESLSEAIQLPFVIQEESVLSGFYNDSTEKFRLRVEAPLLNVGKTNLGDFLFLCENPNDNVKVMLRSTHLPGNRRRNPYFISLNSNIKEDKVNLDFHFSNSAEETYSGSLSFLWLLKDLTSEGLVSDILINPGEIILNDTTWNIHESKIALQPAKVEINDFYLNHDSQYLKINGSNSTTPEDSIHVRFSDLQLGYISEILNQKSITFNGIADGDVYLFQLLKKPFFKGDLNIYDASLNEYLLGDLFVNTFWKEEEKCIAFDSKLMSSFNDQISQSDIFGGVFVGNDSLYIEGDLKDVSLKFLRQYIGSVMQNNTGTASGNVKAYGKFKNIGLEGVAVVKDFAFDVDYLKTSYILSDTVFMTPTSFQLNQAQVFDTESNYGIASGLVLHEGFKNFKFAVDISCNNLLALNTKEQDNEMFYGKAYTSGDVNISGNPEVINFNLNLRTRPNTRITIPIEGTSTASDTDFITFVESTENMTAAEKRRARREKLQKIRENQKSGAELNLVINLEATPDAQIQLIMDSRQGDLIRGTGNGNLRLTYNTKDSDFRMYGNYEIAKGEYLFTIQSIISRKFDIMEGSLVRWTGSPYDAFLDIRAKYTLNASLNELLEDPNIRTTLTPINCLLNLTGTISRPDIKFDLELPNADEEMRRQVRSIINTEEAMNRNIASLLALGHFYMSDRAGTTSNSSELSSVGFSTLSSQLSNWISKINNDISIGLNYRPVSDGVTTSAEFDVALSSQFLNDRLLFNGNFGYREDVTNSPNVSNSIVDFDLEYKLTRSGKIRIKGFNRSNNSYFKQSPNTQGVGIIYREDFDTLGELMRYYWSPFKRLFNRKEDKVDEVKENEDEKKDLN